MQEIFVVAYLKQKTMYFCILILAMPVYSFSRNIVEPGYDELSYITNCKISLKFSYKTFILYIELLIYQTTVFSAV